MDLKALLDDHQTGMSDWQDDYLVTARAGGTVYGQYKQALRELYKRVRGLRELTCDRRILEIKIREAAADRDDFDECATPFSRERAAVEHDRAKMQLEEADRAIADTKRELIRFFQQAVFLKSLVGGLAPDRRRELEREMWEYRIKEMAVIDYLSAGRLSSRTVEMLHACPIDMRFALLKALAPENRAALLEWYESRPDVLRPEDYERLPGPTDADIKKLGVGDG